MGPASFDALSNNTITAPISSQTSPDLLYTTDNRSFANLVATLKTTAEQEQWLLHIILKRTITMYRANATDEKKIVNKSMAVLTKLDSVGQASSGGDGIVLSQ